MSDTMLLGILRMPFDLALATPIAQIQYYQRGVQAADEIEEMRAEVERLRAENEKLRGALKPFSALFLWPDDVGDAWTVSYIRSDEDWDEKKNDEETDDPFVKRGHIRAAREALEAKP